MYLPTSADQSALAQLSRAGTLPLASQVAVRLAYLIAVWTTRHRTRRALRHLSVEQLRDIGLDRGTADLEMTKRFWRP